MKIKNSRHDARALAQRTKKLLLKGKLQKKQKKEVKAQNNKTLIIAQEIKFARLLAGNDKKVRDKVLKSLKKWLILRSMSSFEFTEEDFMRLWKGLFYCMWASDKPLVQEDLAESLSRIVHCFDSVPIILLYIKSTLKTLSTEWFSIDRYRLDKFAMLVRRIFRQNFQICKNKSWDLKLVTGIAHILEELFVDSKASLGFKMHVTELYWEELSKVSCGNIEDGIVTEFIKPFAVYISTIDNEKHIKHVMKHIFRYLIFQSDIGIDYMQKFEAWKQAGFPCGNIDAMQKIDLSNESANESDEIQEQDTKSDNEKEKPLDPRAGRVDVELPQLPFDPRKIMELLKQNRFHPLSRAKTRRQIIHLINEFAEVAEGKMPLGIKEIKISNNKRKETNSKAAAMRLLEFEQNLFFDSAKNKHKKRKNEETEEDKYFDDLSMNDDANKNCNNIETLKNTRSSLNQKSEIVRTDLNNMAVIGSKKMQQDASVTSHFSKKESQRKHTINKKEIRNNPVVFDGTSNKIILKKYLVKKLHTMKLRRLRHSLSSINTSKARSIKDKYNKTKILYELRKGKKKFSQHGSWLVSENTDAPLPSSKINDNTESHGQDDCKLLKQQKSPVMVDLQGQCMILSKDANTHTVASDNTRSKKRVKIVLQRNTTQLTSDYIQQIRKSPAIPFDANKKPLAGVLKSNPIPSPVNPFYKKHVK